MRVEWQIACRKSIKNNMKRSIFINAKHSTGLFCWCFLFDAKPTQHDFNVAAFVWAIDNRSHLHLTSTCDLFISFNASEICMIYYLICFPPINRKLICGRIVNFKFAIILPVALIIFALYENSYQVSGHQLGFLTAYNFIRAVCVCVQIGQNCS